MELIWLMTIDIPSDEEHVVLVVAKSFTGHVCKFRIHLFFTTSPKSTAEFIISLKNRRIGKLAQVIV